MSGKYQRIVLLSHDIDRGINYVPLDNEAVIASILDPNNQSMVSTGLYSQAEVDAKKAAAYQYFLDQYGLDFLNGTVLGNGQFLSGDWFLLPYASGSTLTSEIDVALDTDHKDRGANKKWHGFQFGQLMTCTASGTFTGGAYVGATYTAGDVYGYWDYQLIKTNGGPISPNKQRETWKCYAELPGRFVLGSQGYSDFKSTAAIFDEDNNRGNFYEIIEFVKDLDTNMVSSHTRQTITFS
jgi:hypothetical protein